MGFDWSDPHQPPAGRRGQRGGMPSPQLHQTLDLRAAMQEQFYRVDQLQTDIGGTVRAYGAVLPERAAQTGLVPGFAKLDERATALILEYLDLLDRFDPLEERNPPELNQAGVAFREITPKLGTLADELAAFLARYESELTRIGAAKEQVRRRVAEVVAAVDRAESAWREMHAAGYEFDSADQAIARARIAARKLEGIADGLTPQQVDEPAQVVGRLAAEAEELAVDLPRRAASLRQRIPSLGTRIDALVTRSAGVPETMGQLRREFSAGNWQDLAREDVDVPRLLDAARVRLREIRNLHADGDHTAALGQLTKLQEDLESAEARVDGPRHRLAALREFRADPEKAFGKVRFDLRDARLLLMRGSNRVEPPWAGRLDACARELIELEELLEPRHPDYWEISRRIETLQERIRTLIDDFRRA